MRKERAYALLCILIVGAFLAYTNQRFLFWDETERRIVDVLPRDPAEIPPIFHPSFVSAGESYLEVSDVVVGVVVNGEAKAYPVIVLDRHEVVDDIIGDLPVVVSFCPLTGSAVAFQRPENVLYGVSGKLLRNNLVMYDNDTGSLWSQIMMRAVQGPLKGEPLRVVPSHLIEWAAWVTLFPNTRLLALPTTFKASEYFQNRFASYRTSPDPGIFPVESLNDVIPSKEYVLGVRFGGVTKGYPLSALSSQSLLTDQIRSEAIIVTFCGGSAQAFKAGRHEFVLHPNCTMQDEEGNVWNAVTGEQSDGGESLEALTYITVYWFAWYDFNPDTSLYSDHEG